MADTKTEQIKTLNDKFRTTGLGGRVVITGGVFDLGEDVVGEITKAVREYDTFTEDNDPHGEHDFGSFVVGRQRLFWKIDYYDLTLECGSEDASVPEITTRILTIMTREEY